MARQVSIVQAVVMGVTLVGALGRPAFAAPSDIDVSQGMELRALYGLPAKRSHVEGLLSSGKDVGTDEIGVPMTADELEMVDSNGRAVFADSVRRDVLPWLKRQPGFAGVWLDQSDNGQLVVAYTKSKASFEEGLDARMPKGKRGYRLQQVDHTWDELKAALAMAMGDVGTKLAGADPVMASVHVQLNGIRLFFPEAKVDSARDARQDWQAALGVPVRVEVGNAPVDTVGICTKPDDPEKRRQENCWKPIPAGVRTHSFSDDGRACTMGWQVYKPSGEPPTQFLTAGRHRDIARIRLTWPTEDTEKLYNHPGSTVLHYADVMANDLIRFYGASSQSVKPTHVADAWASWKSETWQYNHASKLTVWGALTHESPRVFSVGGDSGAPVYARFQQGGEWFITPVGIVSGNEPDTNGYMVFTVLEDVFETWAGWATRTAYWP